MTALEPPGPATGDGSFDTSRRFGRLREVRHDGCVDLDVAAGESDPCVEIVQPVRWTAGHFHCSPLWGACHAQITTVDVDHCEASPLALTYGTCRTMPLSDVVMDVGFDEAPDAQGIPMRNLAGRVASVDGLTPAVDGVSVGLEELLHFRVGQRVNATVQGTDVPCAFSLAAVPSFEAAGALKVRSGTGCVHDTLKPGDKVEIVGPWGHFFVCQSARQPAVFPADGLGLSSPMPRIQGMLEEDDGHDTALADGVRRGADLPHHDPFEKGAAEPPRFPSNPALNEPTDAFCTLVQGFLFERDIFTGTFPMNADGAQALARSAFRGI